MSESPIIIVGTGCCGSTIFQKVLCELDGVAWLSGFHRFDPLPARINRAVLAAVDLPLVGPWLGKQRLLEPWESYAFWDRYCPGFFFARS